MPLRSLTALFAAGLLLGACTKQNPNYDPGLDAYVSPDQRVGADLDPSRDGLGPRPDGSQPRDGGPPPSDGPLPVDQALPPDMPQGCQSPADCDDGLECTVDRCVQNRCENTIESDACLIGGVCYEDEDEDPSNSCRQCLPTISQRGWSNAADGSDCQKDGLSCTDDVCKAGTCTHPANGQGCLIAGACYKPNDPSPQSACAICLPAASTTAFTSVDGEPCGTNKRGICVQQSCRSMMALNLASTSTTDASLVAVTYQTSTQQVWAGGGTLGGGGGPGSTPPKGILVRLDGSALGKTQTVNQPVRALSEKLAVRGKTFSYFDTTTNSWKNDTSLPVALSYREREGVFGGIVGGQERYYLGGYVGSQSPGVARCSRAASGYWSCTSHTGFSGGSTLSGLGGTLVASKADQLWAVPFSGYEHIYAHGGSGTSWSRQAPKGCTDAVGAPCYTPFITDFTDLYAGSTSDVWAVGTNGLVMRYDGALWKRFSNVVQYQSSYDLDAVYSDATLGLTIIVGHRDLGYGRYVSLFTYNHTLDRWRGPITVEKRFDYPYEETLILDIGGASATALYFVGHRSDNSGINPWALQLK